LLERGQREERRGGTKEVPSNDSFCRSSFLSMADQPFWGISADGLGWVAQRTDTGTRVVVSIEREREEVQLL
jgi:hypothetical protein